MESGIIRLDYEENGEPPNQPYSADEYLTAWLREADQEAWHTVTPQSIPEQALSILSAYQL